MSEDTVTVELTREELHSVWFALLMSETKAWVDLYAAEGREKLHLEGRRPPEKVERGMHGLSRPPDQTAYLAEITALRQKIETILVSLPAPAPPPKRRAKAGAA